MSWLNTIGGFFSTIGHKVGPVGKVLGGALLAGGAAGGASFVNNPAAPWPMHAAVAGMAAAAALGLLPMQPAETTVGSVATAGGAGITAVGLAHLLGPDVSMPVAGVATAAAAFLAHRMAPPT